VVLTKVVIKKLNKCIHTRPFSTLKVRFVFKGAFDYWDPQYLANRLRGKFTILNEKQIVKMKREII
jgi:hypothetical protein